MLTAIDWFAGKGGYTSAMRDAGIEVVGACERDSLRRSDYVALHGWPQWFGEDCLTAEPPRADLWTACAAAPLLVKWLKSRTWPRTLVLETVTRSARPLESLVEWAWPRATQRLEAGRRVFFVLTPTPCRIGRLPPHDGHGPESDPVALAEIFGALDNGLSDRTDCHPG